MILSLNSRSKVQRLQWKSIAHECCGINLIADEIQTWTVQCSCMQHQMTRRGPKSGAGTSNWFATSISGRMHVSGVTSKSASVLLSCKSRAKWESYRHFATAVPQTTWTLMLACSHYNSMHAIFRNKLFIWQQKANMTTRINFYVMVTVL